jgi:hypothetical protein
MLEASQAAGCSTELPKTWKKNNDHDQFDRSLPLFNHV